MLGGFQFLAITGFLALPLPEARKLAAPRFNSLVGPTHLGRGEKEHTSWSSATILGSKKPSRVFKKNPPFLINIKSTLPQSYW